MKILNLIPYTPVPPAFGGALRVYHLLRWMARHHEVHVLAYGSPDDPARMEAALGQPANRTTMVPIPRWLDEKWKRFGQIYSFLRNTSFTEVVSRNKDMQRALDRCLDQNSFDVVQIAYPVMGYFTFRTDAVRVLDGSNVEYDIHRRVAQSATSAVRRWWSDYEYRKLYPQEIAISREQDGIFLPSQRDIDLLAKDVPDVPMFVIPNGVDTSYFRLDEGGKEEHSLVFTGAINYYPNTEAVEFFVNQVLPQIRARVPDVKLYVVGNSPPESVRALASDHVVVTGFVDDVRPYVQRSSVYVVPLLSGGGTRLKVLEAMSMGRPIVTTSVGCEGIPVVDGESVLIADGAAAFADATVRLLRDKELQRRLTPRGLELVRSRYDWSTIGGQLEDAYTAVFEARRGRNKRSA